MFRSCGSAVKGLSGATTLGGPALLSEKYSKNKGKGAFLRAIIMANENVEVPDDTIVVVDIPEDEPAEGAAKPGGNGAAAAAVTTGADAADEAAAALTQAQKSVEDSRRRESAAIATANAERQRADAATRAATQAKLEADEARESAGSSDLALAVAGVESATRAMASAKAELRRASEAGEFDKVADAQEQIALAAADLKDFNNRKTAIESGTARKSASHEGRVEPQTYSSPAEQYIANSNFAPAAQAWLRAHPECLPANVGGDPDKNKAMMKGHHSALAEGTEVNSQRYFEIIEEKAGYRTPTSAAAVTTAAGSEEAAPAPKPAARKAPPLSAPPSRDPPAASGAPSRQRSVQLNGAQQEIALISFPAKAGEDDAAHRKRAFGTYARELVAATAEGKIGRMTH